MQIKTGFSQLSSANFVAQVELILSSLTGNTNFPEPWPSTVSSLAQLQADFASYQDVLNDTNSGNESRIPDREAARQTLVNELTAVAFYLQSVAKGDAAMLGSTGFALKKTPQRVLNAEPLPAPDGLTLARGTLSGSLLASFNRMPKAASYDVQTTTADPTVEANWSAAGSYTGCRRIELDGLTPGKMYSVRVRALGAAGPGAWTSASSLMVV